jgi:hypothetical protein
MKPVPNATRDLLEQQKANETYANRTKYLPKHIKDEQKRWAETKLRNNLTESPNWMEKQGINITEDWITIPNEELKCGTTMRSEYLPMTRTKYIIDGIDMPKPRKFITQNMNLLDAYHVVGFDVDHGLVKYHKKALAELIMDIYLSDFHEKLGYPAEIKEFDDFAHLLDL